MTPELWQRVKGALEELSGTDPEGRLRLLAALEPDTRREVERLLPGLEATPSREHSSLLLPDPETLAEWIAGAQTFEAGQVLNDRFEIDRALGRGGMGEVFSAHDRLLGKVAIKTLLPEFVSSRAMVERFRSEVLRGRAVSHPNVCRIHDLFDTENDGEGGVPFFTMELIDGPVLSTWIPARAGLPEQEATALAEALCAGLQAAHEAGVIHGDFKAANVMLSPQPDGTFRPKITDFGLAREVPWLLAADTPEGTGVRGTKPYLAPELMAGSSASVSSDIFALGVVLYFLRTARYPYPETEWEEAQRQRQKAPAFATLIRECGETWGRAIFACLQPESLRRPPSAAAVAQLLLKPAQTTDLERRHLMGAILVGTLTGTATRWVWPRPYSAPRGKLRTLVEDFESVGTSPAVGRAFQNFFRLALAKSPRVELVPPREIAEAMQSLGLGTQRLREAIASGVSVRTHTKLRVEGDIRTDGGRYRLSCRAHEVDSGRVVLPWRSIAVKAFDLPAGAAQLAATFRRDLGERAVLAQLSDPLEQADSSIPEALEAFSLGVNLYYSGERDAAIEKLQEATRLDSDFAIAYVFQALVHVAFRRPDRAIAAVSRAYPLMDRLDSHHRHHLHFLYLHLIGDYQGALDQISLLARLFPDDPSTQRQLASCSVLAGRPDLSLAPARHALELDPGNGMALNGYISALAENNQPNEAQQLLAQALRDNPSSGLMLYAQAYLHLLNLEPDSALAILEPLAARNGISSPSRGQAIKAKVMGGRLAEAQRDLERDVSLRDQAGDTHGASLCRWWLGQVAFATGDNSTAQSMTETLSRLDAQPVNMDCLRGAAELAWHLGLAGLARRAAVALAAIERLFPSSRSRSFAHFAEALASSALGAREAAESRIHQAHSLWPDVINSWAYGELLLEKERPQEAAGFFVQAINARTQGVRFDAFAVWVKCHARAAVALDAAGQSSASLSYAKVFEKLWGPPQQHHLVRLRHPRPAA